MAAAGTGQPGIILIHHLRIGLKRHTREFVAVFEFKRAFTIDVVGMSGEIEVGEIILYRGARMALAAKLLGLGQADLQSRQGTNRQVQGVVIDVGLDLGTVELGEEEFKLPWTQPAQYWPA